MECFERKYLVGRIIVTEKETRKRETDKNCADSENDWMYSLPIFKKVLMQLNIDRKVTRFTFLGDTINYRFLRVKKESQRC